MNDVVCAADIAKLPEAFSALWDSAERACGGPTLTRSLTQNIVVVTDAAKVAEMHAMIDSLLDRHPCRALVVALEDAQALNAELFGRVRPEGSGRSMVLERLTIRADWASFPKLPNLIRPLLVSDIPTSLFWATRLPESLGKIAAMATLADHTIVDSTLFEGDDWRALQQLSDHTPFDLGWLRTTPWRRSLAEAFEHFEWQPDEPPTEVELRHGKAFGSLAACRILEHWMVEKLGAKVRLLESDGDGPTGEPWSLELNHGPVHILIRHLVEDPRLHVSVTLSDRCLLPQHVQSSRGTRAGLLAAALDIAW